MKYVNVPEIFRPKDTHPYPRHQTGPGLEDRAEQYFKLIENSQITRLYLPIKWTAYQIAANYGHEPKKIFVLKNYCNSLYGPSAVVEDKPKFFTVVQYDDGNLAPVRGCRVFGAGGIGDDPIPLVTDRHQVKALKKIYLASFLGSIGTHPIRKQMADALSGKDMFMVENVETKRENMPRFTDVTEQSCFTLCPRGYGKTSFRLYEAMQLGSVPVYISDDHWLPFQKYVDWEEFCVIIKEKDIERIPEILMDRFNTGRYKSMAIAAKGVYDQHFCYEATLKNIMKLLLEEVNELKK